jgi:hypothetical protein
VKSSRYVTVKAAAYLFDGQDRTTVTCRTVRQDNERYYMAEVSERYIDRGPALDGVNKACITLGRSKSL